MMGKRHIALTVGLVPIFMRHYDKMNAFILKHEWLHKVTSLWSLKPDVQFGIGLVLGSLLPDIDSPHSILGRFVYLPVEHRTWTHSIYPVLGLVVLGHFFPFALYVAIGYFFHLLVDALSTQGVSFFRPINGYVRYDSGAKVKKNHALRLYKTGSVSEVLVFLFISGIELFVIFYGTSPYLIQFLKSLKL